MIAITLLLLAPAAEWTTADAAVRLAAADARQLSADELPWTRWAWSPRSDATTFHLLSFTCNSVLSELSTASIVLPEARGAVVRINLRKLAPRDPTRLAKLWDRLADPYLYATATPPARLVDVAPYKHTDGKTYTKKWVAGVPRKSFGSHLSAEAVADGERLRLATLSEAPIVRAEELIRRALTALDDGLYYELLGVPDDYDTFLNLFGVEQQRVEQLDSQRKAAMIRSKVTDMPRAVLVFPTLAVGSDIAVGNHWISQDIGKDDRRVAQHPLRNLLNNEFVAGEACTVGNNGRLIWTLWQFDRQQGKLRGTLQRSVPDAIAQDGTVVHPHDRRLQASVSCWRCHLLEKHDGFKPFTNDVAELSRAGVEVFGDAAAGDKGTSDVLAKLASLYGWNSDKVLRRQRDDFADFVVRTTGRLSPTALGESITGFFDSYWHAGVSPEVAVAELGLKLTPKQTARDALRAAIPPRVPLTGDVLAEDVVLGLLKSGATVTRRDWEGVYQEAVARLKR